MPRPKGSKNKKKSLTAADIASQITAQEEVKKALENEQAEILAAIEKQKQLLRAKKKELRTAEKTLLMLQEKKAEAEAIEAASAKKAEIEAAVTKLVSSGKSAEEILEMLKK